MKNTQTQKHMILSTNADLISYIFFAPLTKNIFSPWREQHLLFLFITLDKINQIKYIIWWIRLIP